MIDLFDLYSSFKSYVNTSQGGWFRPKTDFEQACNDISNQLWEYYTGMGDKSQKIKDSLAPFLKSENVKVTSEKGAYGTFEFPENYGRFSSARIILIDDKCYPDPNVNGGKCNGIVTEEEKTELFYKNIKEREVTTVDNKRWAAAIDHDRKGPSMSNPLITQIEGKFKVAPRDISVLAVDYYEKPKKAVFNYQRVPGNPQTGAGDQIQYVKAGSESLPWPETMINEFLVRLGERYSYFTREQFWAQFNSQQKATA